MYDRFVIDEDAEENAFYILDVVTGERMTDPDTGEVLSWEERIYAHYGTREFNNLRDQLRKMGVVIA